MKVWLNNLKPGDKFWTYDWKGPREVEIVGQDINPSFIMPRWKLNNGTSILVNRYVFTTKEEAVNDYLPKLKEKLSKLEKEFMVNNFKKENTISNSDSDELKLMTELLNTLQELKDKLSK